MGVDTSHHIHRRHLGLDQLVAGEGTDGVRGREEEVRQVGQEPERDQHDGVVLLAGLSPGLQTVSTSADWRDLLRTTRASST